MPRVDDASYPAAMESCRWFNGLRTVLPFVEEPSMEEVSETLYQPIVVEL